MNSVEGHLIVGHHTLVTMERAECGLFYINTRRITPQRDQTIAELMATSWSSMVRQQIAFTQKKATEVFAEVSAFELAQEAEAMAALEY